MMKFSLMAAALALAAGGAAAQGTAPNDAQIAGILVTANQLDIEGGKNALPKATDKQVKGFAQEMITDHTASNKQASQLLSKLNIKPEEGPTTKKLKTDGEESTKKLQALSGAAFDKAYMDHEVTVHETVLDTIDKTLLPNAKNDELKKLITNTRPVIAAHLQHARQIQGSLGK